MDLLNLTDTEFRNLALKNMGISVSAGHTPGPSMLPTKNGTRQALASAKKILVRPRKKHSATPAKQPD